MNNKIFPDDNITCTQPWDSIRILGTGHVQPCSCMGTRGYPAMTDAGPDFYEHWRSSEEIQGIRSRIQNGVKEARCSRCYEEESVSKNSFRGRFNAQTAVYAGPHFRDSLEQNPIWTRMQDLTVKSKAMPAYVTLFWGNTCNSRCLMCTPLNSAEVAKDYRDFGYDFEEFGLRGREDELCASLEWPEHEHGESRYQSILNMIVNNDRLIYLKQNGGEGFIQPTTKRLLRDIVKHGKHDFNYVINTNCTVWDQEILDLASTFDYSQLDLAIETLDKSNEYLRHGCKQDNVLKLIDRYHKECSGSLKPILKFVPNALSILTLDTLIDYARNTGMDLQGNTLYKPLWMRIQILPKNIKQDLLNRYRTKYNIFGHDERSVTEIVMTDLESQHKDYMIDRGHLLPIALHQLVVKLIKFLEAPEPNDVETHRRTLIRHVKMFDNKHKTSFLDNFPELEEMYHTYQ